MSKLRSGDWGGGVVQGPSKGERCIIKGVGEMMGMGDIIPVYFFLGKFKKLKFENHFF